jgi:hypothetical protein
MIVAMKNPLLKNPIALDTAKRRAFQVVDHSTENRHR